MKRSFFRHIVLCFLLNFSLVLTVSAKPLWLSLETENFHLAGNVGATELQTVARKLETFHRYFRQTLPNLQIETPFRINLIIFKKESELSFQLQPGSQDFWMSDESGDALLSTDKPEALKDFKAGYAKFLLENNVGKNNLPVWLFEGLAEYFQTSETEKLVRSLPQNKMIPIDVLLETDHFTLQSQESERKLIFRAEAWVLLQYLLKDAKDLTKIEKFIELKKRGMENRNAMAQAFETSLAKIKSELPKFIEANNFTEAQTDFDNNPSPEKVGQLAQISESDWFAVQADFLYGANRLKDSEVLIEKSLKLEPNQSLALTTLALIKARGFSYDEAEALAEKAIENEPDNFLNHFRSALVTSKRGMTEYGFVSGYNAGFAHKIREASKRAIELNPDFIPAYALLVFVNAARNEDLDESIGLIQRALHIAPGNHQYQLRLAELNLRKEKFAEARKLAFQVLENTERGGVKLYAQNTIQRIDATEYQLERLRREKTIYVNDEIVTEKPLTDEEIKRLREQATIDQIRAVLRRPGVDEKRVFGSLSKIECSKNRIDFLIKTQMGWQRFHAGSLDTVRLLSLVEEMSDYRLNCGSLVRENNASIILNRAGEIVSIEFVPKGFK